MGQIKKNLNIFLITKTTRGCSPLLPSAHTRWASSEHASMLVTLLIVSLKNKHARDSVLHLVLLLINPITQ